MKRPLILLSIILSLFLWTFATEHVFANKKVGVDIELGIINGYSGTLSFIDTYYFDGTSYFTNTTSIDLLLASNTTSTFTVESDSSAIGTGSGIGNYDTTLSAPLIGIDRTFTFQASFTNPNNEWVQSNILTIIKDTAPPPTVNQFSIQIANAGGNSGYIVSWDESTDSGVGLSGYQVVFASDTSFINSKSFTTQSGPLVIDKSLIPVGYTTIQILAIDALGNSSASSPIQFSPASLMTRDGGSSSLSKQSQSYIPPSITPGLEDVGSQESEPANNPQPTTPPVLFFIEKDDIDTSLPQDTTDSSSPLITILPTAPSQEGTPIIGVVSPEELPTVEADSLFAIWSNPNQSSGVYGVGSSPYSQILICSDEQCIEIDSYGVACGGAACIATDIQTVHFVAQSDDQELYQSFIEYHQQRSRLITYFLFLIYYSICYDIEIHLNRQNFFLKKK